MAKYLHTVFNSLLFVSGSLLGESSLSPDARRHFFLLVRAFCLLVTHLGLVQLHAGPLESPYLMPKVAAFSEESRSGDPQAGPVLDFCVANNERLKAQFEFGA